MNITCQEREKVFLDGSPEEWAALELHAATCAECDEELRAWKNLSVAAQEMREEPESPVLWPRIESSLKEQDAVGAKAGSWWRRLKNWTPLSLGWQTALAGAMALVLVVCAVYVYKGGRRVDDVKDSASLLKSPALREVEKSERIYEQAIEHLEAEAKPQLRNTDSPLVASYREKLMILDGAIDELRAQAGENPSNAHLRRQLLAMYQEKQETLQDVLEIKR